MIQKIWIKSFRCLSELSLDFKQHRFISIVAHNNVGKTALLESCYVLGYLKSFNTNRLSQVVPFNGQSTYLGIQVLSTDQYAYNYYLKIDSLGKKYVTLNNEMIKRKSDIEHLFRTVYISSDSLFLITGSPSFRRDQIDLFISQLSLTYRKNIAQYKRIIAQKNKALKQTSDPIMIKQLNAQLAPLIKHIMSERAVYIEKIYLIMETYFKQIGIVDGQLEIDYKPNLNLSMTVHDIQLLLDQSIQKEVLFKNSILGPHRDDFQFMINGHLCRDYYSRGVSRVVSYLFQLSIAVLIQRDTSLSMLLLLDEPFAEIFHTIKKKLIEYIPKSFYIIYTSTQTDEISELSKDSIFKIDKGVLCKI